jgi:hypothetical protein
MQDQIFRLQIVCDGTVTQLTSCHGGGGSIIAGQAAEKSRRNGSLRSTAPWSVITVGIAPCGRGSVKATDEALSVCPHAHAWRFSVDGAAIRYRLREKSADRRKRLSHLVSKLMISGGGAGAIEMTGTVSTRGRS